MLSSPECKKMPLIAHQRALFFMTGCLLIVLPAVSVKYSIIITRYLSSPFSAFGGKSPDYLAPAQVLYKQVLKFFVSKKRLD
jgi:hypothetical protein